MLDSVKVRVPLVLAIQLDTTPANGAATFSQLAVEDNYIASVQY